MMNDYWHIPRASLTPSSAASSSAASLASSSNRSNRSTNLHPTAAVSKNFAHEDHQKERRNSSRVGRTTISSSSRSPTPINVHRATHDGGLSKTQNAIESGGKRGSNSSQGSNKSNNSTRSASSGSMLLTAANLERFVEIHKKQEKAVKKQMQKQNQSQYYLSGEQGTTGASGAPLPGTNYNSNLVQAVANGHIYGQDQGMQQQGDDANNANGDAIITMDPNLDFIKAKNLDNISIASSMHFTMVNGEGGPAKKVKRGLCDRGRQVTVLITSMSTIFLLLIMGMVYALEMRAREMPKS